MESTKRQRVDPNRWPGVYFYQSENRRFLGRPDVCYHITYKVDGKKVWESVGWKSDGYTPQAAAELRSERLRNARHVGQVQTARDIRKEENKRNRLFSEIATAYFDAKGNSLKGLTTDKNRYEHHVKPIIGHKPVGSMSELDLASIRRAMDGKAAATVWNALELVRRVVNFGVRAKMCPPLPFKIKMPKKDNEIVEYLSPEEVERFLKVLEEWPSRDVPRMLKLAMFTGMRRGELFKLTDDDLDFQHGLIRILAPKGGKTKTIPINLMALEIIKEQLAARDKQHPSSKYVFPGQGGNMRADCRAVYRIKKAAGLPDGFRPFHGLRHHFAVMLANSGEYTLDMIGQLLTHQSQAMTMRYAQFLPETIHKASERAADIIGGK